MTPATIGAGAVGARPVASVPGLEAHCRDLAAHAGLLHQDAAAFALVGSALRSAWTHEPWRDVDAVPVHGSPESIVADADFTICQAAVHDGRLLHGPRFFADLGRRVLVVNRVDPASAFPTLLRMYKYAARGFAVPLAQLHRVLDEARRAPDAELPPEAVLRLGGGVILPNAAPGAGGGALRRLELSELPLAAAPLRALDDALGRAAGRALRYHVHGGFVRAALTGESYGDVDVAAATAADLLALRAVARRPVAVRGASGAAAEVRLDVRRRVVATPAELLADVDVVAARVAFSTTDGCLHADAGCFDALAAGTLALRAGPLANPERAIARTLKGAAKGGRLPLADLRRALAALREAPPLAHWLQRRLRTLRHPGAFVAGAPRDSH